MKIMLVPQEESILGTEDGPPSLMEAILFFFRNNFVGVLSISDIRKYLIVRRNKRVRDESSEKKTSAENEKKAKRWKQTDIGCYYVVPETCIVTPKPIQMKRRRKNNNHESYNEMNKRNKLSDGATSWPTNNDERLKQGGTKRKMSVYCAHSRKKRTNIMMSDVRKKATDANVYVLLDNPLLDPALAGSRVP